MLFFAIKEKYLNLFYRAIGVERLGGRSGRLTRGVAGRWRWIGPLGGADGVGACLPVPRQRRSAVHVA